MKCVDCNIRGNLDGDTLDVGAGKHSHPPDELLEKVANLKDVFKSASKRMLGGNVSKVFAETCNT